MNLRKPFITTLLIVLLVINLIFLSFLVSIKHVATKDYLSSKVRDFDIVSYIKDRDYIKEHINNFKYPEEVYDYINLYNFYQFADQSIDNLLDKKSTIVDSGRMNDILTKSVSLYDLKNGADSMSYVKEDIARFSSELAYKINNDGFVQIVKVLLFIVNTFIYFIPYLIAILLSTLLIIYEKRNGILINGIIYIIYSFYLYYFNSHFITRFNNSGSIYSYLKGIKKYTFELDNLYMICFILSFVLLLIYIVMYIKKVIRDVRLSSYENWR